MIEIKSKKELKGVDRYGDCNSCGKTSKEAELYQILLHYENSTKNNVVNLCRDCMNKLSCLIEMEELENGK